MALRRHQNFAGREFSRGVIASGAKQSYGCREIASSLALLAMTSWVEAKMVRDVDLKADKEINWNSRGGFKLTDLTKTLSGEAE